MKGKGNRHRQNEKRKLRRKTGQKKLKQNVCLIDGNFSYYPSAFCVVHNGFLTKGLMDTHRCEKRNCDGLEVFDEIIIDGKSVQYSIKNKNTENKE